MPAQILALLQTRRHRDGFGPRAVAVQRLDDLRRAALGVGGCGGKDDKARTAPTGLIDDALPDGVVVELQCATDDDGCPSEAVWKGKRRGGWQEDAHTDKLHNFVDAMNAFPEWAK